MRDALKRAADRQCAGSTIEVIDVDADPALLARYDELVPVLFGDRAATALCHYFLDQAMSATWQPARFWLGLNDPQTQRYPLFLDLNSTFALARSPCI